MKINVSLRVVVILLYSTSWEAKNEQVRIKVKDAMVWDMNKPEMLKGTALDGVLVDCVISCLNVCTTSSTIDDYFGVIKNIRYMGIKHIAKGKLTPASKYL